MKRKIAINDDFGYWLAGFTDGEGCFLVNYNISSRNNSTIECGVAFQIGLRHDDLPLLQYIRETLGIGTITESIKNSWTDSAGKYVANPKSTYTVCARNEVMNITALFEKYPLRSKKKRDFDIWKIAAKEYSINGATRNGIFKELKELLQRVRRYNSNGVENFQFQDKQLRCI